MVTLGQVFGRLTVIALTAKRRSHSKVWVCVCICGTVLEVSGTNLSSGDTHSCGCLRRELVRVRSVAAAKHGHLRDNKCSSTYNAWRNMRQRCNNPKHMSYPYYGGAGIQVCPRWQYSFKCFLDDMGERPLGYSLDRIDSKLNYEQGNCRWVPSEKQAQNKRNNRVLTLNGESFILAEWSRRTDIPSSVITSRLARGWSLEAALSVPVKKKSSLPQRVNALYGSAFRARFKFYYKHLYRGPGDDLTFEQWQLILKQHEYKCAYCHVALPTTMDHVIPLIKGGLHTASNVVPACKHCNSSKQGKSLEQWGH